MQRFYVEGLFVRKGGRKSLVEPFGQVVWAENAAEALRMASEALQGGRWVEGPSISDQTEEQRMRKLGAPQLPGFGPSRAKAKPARR